MKGYGYLFGTLTSQVLVQGANFEIKVRKGQNFSQTGAGLSASATNQFYFEAIVGDFTAFEPVLSPLVIWPNRPARTAVPTDEGAYGITQSLPSQGNSYQHHRSQSRNSYCKQP
jgi:hypothetical protein